MRFDKCGGTTKPLVLEACGEPVCCSDKSEASSKWGEAGGLRLGTWDMALGTHFGLLALTSMWLVFYFSMTDRHYYYT